MIGKVIVVSTQAKFNDRGSARYREIDRANLNKPVGEMQCPHCEERNVKRDKETSDHPGVFRCDDCLEVILA